MKTWLSLGISVGVIGLFMACDDETKIIDDGTGGSTTSSSSSSSSGTTSSSGVTSSSSSSGTTGCGNFVWSTDAACQGCMETNCCSQLLACNIATPCEQLFTCLEACSADDQPCIDACFAAHGAGQPAAQALYQCGETACADACGATGICDTELGYQSELMNQCLTDNCCDDYLPCYNDIDCNACLLNPEGPGCDTNALWATYEACLNTNCPADICESGIGFYPNDEPAIECHACLATAVSSDPTVTCCDLMDTCLGPDPANPDTNLCIACLNGDTTGCTNGSDEWNAAEAFITDCVNTGGACATECTF